MSKWKIPDALGFSALINFIKQTKQDLEATASDVTSLRGDILGLADQTTSTFEQVDAALATIDTGKLDKTNEATASIPTSGWGSDTSVVAYPKFCDLTATGVTAKDRASVTIALASAQTAVSCGICPTCETLTGKIRIRSAQIPSAAISVRYWIEKGKV